MAVVPVIISGVFYPKGKAAGDKPMVGTLVGNAAIAGLSVGGGPAVPPLPPNTSLVADVPLKPVAGSAD